MTSAGSFRYGLILGQGRSGTNYLLALLNQSPHTHTRNEPDQLADSSFTRLADMRYFVDAAGESDLETLWDATIAQASLCAGPRDHILIHPKEWLHPGMQGPATKWLRWRYILLYRYLKRAQPMYGREVRLPFWLTSRKKLEHAFHVFKLNAAVGQASWMLRHRPEGKALHIVRHPGGFTKSWLKRWVETRGDANAERATKDRLKELARFDPTWGQRFGDADALSFIAAELWFWRWCNETLAAAGAGKAGYHRIIYEDLAEQPVATAQDVFRFCGVPWDSVVEQRVREVSRESQKIARAWKDELARDVIVTIEQVLDGSALSGWWPA